MFSKVDSQTRCSKGVGHASIATRVMEEWRGIAYIALAPRDHVAVQPVASVRPALSAASAALDAS
eukprot:6468311-Amphidinium_carterae.2